MNSSNSFNICPRCGNANSLNAKFCARCGGQLKVPEEPIVCHKCHTRNSPMANYCRSCGVELKVGLATKICPKCGKEVGANDNVCSCGYSFVTLQKTQPVDQAVNVAETNDTKVFANDDKPKKVYKTKGGRGWAIAALVLILLFAYYVVAPYIVSKADGEVGAKLRPDFLVNFDGGFVNKEGASVVRYGYDYISTLVQCFSGEQSFGENLKMISNGNIMLIVVTVIFVVAALAHLVVSIIRTCIGKRAKFANWTFLALAALTTIVVGLIALFSYCEMPESLAKIANWFALNVPGEEPVTNLGYAIWAIPVYFWFFYLYSLLAKAKKLKEEVA